MADLTTVRKITIAVANKFPSFGGGRTSPWGNPVAEALKGNPPSFAANVPIEEVVKFILEQAKENSK